MKRIYSPLTIQVKTRGESIHHSSLIACGEGGEVLLLRQPVAESLLVRVPRGLELLATQFKTRVVHQVNLVMRSRRQASEQGRNASRTNGKPREQSLSTQQDVERCTNANRHSQEAALPSRIFFSRVRRSWSEVAAPGSNRRRLARSKTSASAASKAS